MKTAAEMLASLPEGFLDQFSDGGVTTSKIDLIDPSPCDDFLERIPERLIDPISRKEITISQSLMKALRLVDVNELCPKRFYHVWISKRVVESRGSVANQAGSRFEYQLTGAKDYHGNVPGELLTAVRREPSSAQKKIDEQVKQAKNTLLRVGVPKTATAQYKLSWRCLSGSADLRYISDDVICIDDIKYSGLLGEFHGPLSWHPDTLTGKTAHMIQAGHYTLLALLAGDGLQVRFRFIVFHPDHYGKYQVFQVNISDDAMNMHKNMVVATVDYLQKKIDDHSEWDSIGSYDKCKGCPLKHDCEGYIKYPETVVVTA